MLQGACCRVGISTAGCWLLVEEDAWCKVEGCDEALSQLEMLVVLYPDMMEFSSLSTEYSTLGRKINSYIDYVDNNWRT